MPQAERSLRVVLLGGQSDSLTIYRGPLIRALIAQGHQVLAVAGDPEPAVLRQLEAWGASFQAIPLKRAGRNPWQDLKALVALVMLLRRERPDALLAYQIKPVTFGLMASWLAGTRRRIAMITGLGYAFVEGPGWRRRLARAAATVAYRLSLPLAHKVVFQNNDDREMFDKLGLVPLARSTRVNGSGVDLMRYPPKPANGGAHFLMISRLLRDKGVYEFAEAARRVKATVPDARFTLVGPSDPNPSSVDPADLATWVEEGVLEYAGRQDDVRPYLAASDVFVLPSYREGVPLAALEAMATSRPVIATDVPGCRDAVVTGDTGFTVPARDAEALAAAMLRLVAEPGACEAMGKAGRRRVEALFSAEAVTAEVIAILTPTCG